MQQHRTQAATLVHVCATPHGYRSQGSDSAGRFPTMAVIELGLVDLPDAARTSEEGECHRATDRQQLGWPDDRHANTPTWRTVVASAAAAETCSREAAIGPSLEVGTQRPPRAVTARAVDVQLQAVPADVAYRLEGQSLHTER